MACSCNGKCSRCKKNGGIIHKKQSGGLLRGPSHAQGGIPAIVGGTTPVELEGGEYIIRKSSVNKYGEGTIARINQGLVDTNKLQQLKKGGKIIKRRNGGKITRNKTILPAKMAKGGKLKPTKMKKGGVTKHKKPRRYRTGGITTRGLGTNGAAMNYKKGGKIKRGRK